MLALPVTAAGRTVNQVSVYGTTLEYTDHTNVAHYTHGADGVTGHFTTNYGGTDITRITEVENTAGNFETYDSPVTFTTGSTAPPTVNIETYIVTTLTSTGYGEDTITYTTGGYVPTVTFSTYESGTSTLTSFYTQQTSTEYTTNGVSEGTDTTSSTFKTWIVGGYDTAPGFFNGHYDLVMVDDDVSDAWLFGPSGFGAWTDRASKATDGQVINLLDHTTSQTYSIGNALDYTDELVLTAIDTVYQMTSSSRTVELETRRQTQVGDGEFDAIDFTITRPAQDSYEVTRSTTGVYDPVTVTYETTTLVSVEFSTLKTYTENAVQVGPSDFCDLTETTTTFRSMIYTTTVAESVQHNFANVPQSTGGGITAIDVTGGITDYFLSVPHGTTGELYGASQTVGFSPLAGQGFVPFGAAGQEEGIYRGINYINNNSLFDGVEFLLDDSITALAVPPAVSMFITHRSEFNLSWSNSNNTETGIATLLWVTNTGTTTTDHITGAGAQWSLSIGSTTTTDGPATVDITLTTKASIQLQIARDAHQSMDGFVPALDVIGGFSPWESDGDCLLAPPVGAFRRTIYNSTGGQVATEKTVYPTHTSEDITYAAQLIAYESLKTIRGWKKATDNIHDAYVQVERWHQNTNPQLP